MDGTCPSPVEVLRASGVEHVVSEHPPIRGQADVERVLRLPSEQLLKTVVFRRARGGYILVALPAASRVSYARLAAAVAVPRAELRQAEAEDLAQLGMEPGGASPVCEASGVTIVFDSAVVRMGRVYCGSGRADQTVEVEVEALLRLVRPIVADVGAPA